MMFRLVHVQSLVNAIVEERTGLYFLLKLTAVDKVWVKQHSPSSDRYQLPVLLLASDLSGSDAYQRPVLIIIPAAAGGKIKVIVILHEDAVNRIVVEAVPDRRYFRIVDDGYQRMRIGLTQIAAVIGSFLYL